MYDGAVVNEAVEYVMHMVYMPEIRDIMKCCVHIMPDVEEVVLQLYE